MHDVDEPADLDRGSTTNRAIENLRRHTWRAVSRVAALLTVDAACFMLVRAITRRVADPPFGNAAGLLASWPSAFEANELALGVALLVGTTVSGTYGPGDARRHVGRLFVAAALASALPLWAQLWSQPLTDAIPTWFVVFAPLFITLVALRTAYDTLVQRWSHRTGGASARTVLIGTAADCLARRDGAILGRGTGFDTIGFVDVAPRAHRSALGVVTDIERILVEQGADTVIFCGFPNPATTSRVLRAAAAAECTVLASAPQLELPTVRPNVIKQVCQPLLELRPVALRAEQLIVKRAMDLLGATVMLVLLAPLLAIAALLISIDSPGPVVFAQRRLGRFGRRIRCYKFRSMYVDAEARLSRDSELFRRYVAHDYKLPASIDTRITRIGRLLRRTSIDELPQLWNVLRGDMSLVGPRPIVPDEIQHYNGEGPLLLSLKPGMTGAWQVGGRSKLTYPKRCAVELEYVEGWSLWRDIGILLRTLPVVLTGRGAH